MHQKRKIILASKSPRRKEILDQLGLDFAVEASSFEEKDEHLTPEELAAHNAIGKARQIAKKHRDALVIGVDTVVAFQSLQINKPRNKKDAERILKVLSGRTHKVFSAVCVIDTKTNNEVHGVQETLVTMKKMTEKEIENYIATGEGSDKAGSYAIQGKAALFIKRIEGDYFNVVGLPVFLLGKLMKKLDKELI